MTASSSHTDEENNTDSQPPSKKRKSALQDELDTSIRSQNEELHDLREQINEYLDKDSQIQILKQNQQSVPRDKIEVKFNEHLILANNFVLSIFHLSGKNYPHEMIHE